jgi:4'-phosphopantetheinyl transferase
MVNLYLFTDYSNISCDLLCSLISQLPYNRREKAKNYKNTSDKISCAVSYYLLLYGLRNDFGIFDFQIGTQHNGKPYLSSCSDIYFNLSHCKYGCVCAISEKEVGVDIQDIRDVSDSVIKKVCCNNEIQVIEKSADKSRAFTKIWAMKEAYTKMLGTGIVCELDKIDTTKLSKKISVTENDKYIIAVAVSED